MSPGARLLIAFAVLAATMAAAPASAQIADVPGNQGPPAAGAPTDVQPGPVLRCKRARLACVKRLERHLTAEWKRYDATCDHRAVVLYSYLEITKGLRRDLAGPRPGIVSHRRWMTYLLTTFSNRFRDAFSDFDAGRPVPDGWRIAFETYDEGDANAGQDVLLFSSVHVQHDLPFALEEMGTATPAGASRKLDHDAVNAINRDVFDPIQDYIAAHYDPSFGAIDGGPSPLDETATLEVVETWRENGWRYAEQLLAAKTPAERDAVVGEIRSNARSWAERISSGGIPGTRSQRDSFCAANHEFG
ncbi:MAG: DUF5995 family protein [Solirubrobacterales bacterium]